jgi:hypothetical protein
MNQFVREKQHCLMHALENKTVVKGTTVISYYAEMNQLFLEFKLELFNNISIAGSLTDCLKYINRVNSEFKAFHRLFHSSFSLELFPNMIIENNSIKKNLTPTLMFAQ